MKKIRLIFFLVLPIILFSFDKKDDAVFYSKDHFKNELWYKIMVAKLTQENRADAASAHSIRLISSDSYIAFEKSMPKLIEKLGKITEEEIRVLFKEKEKDSTVFVFIETLNNFHNLFTFNVKTAKLTRVQNKGTIALSRVRITLKENNSEGILFYANSKNEATGKVYRQHLYFDRVQNTFEHTKSCEIVKGVETCKNANH